MYYLFKKNLSTFLLGFSKSLPNIFEDSVVPPQEM